MGNDLPNGPRKKSPQIAVWALQDINSAKLQRIQIIKGYIIEVDENEMILEKIFDVACSDGLKPNPTTHRCPSNRASVDLGNCNYSKNKGANELSALWTDPEFDRKQPAFYYARIIENPTCRWSTHDAIQLGMAIPKGVPATIQERAWSSPIWYTP